MGQENNCPAVWWPNIYLDRVGIMQWDSGSVTLAYGISNCSRLNILKDCQISTIFVRKQKYWLKRFYSTKKPVSNRAMILNFGFLINFVNLMNLPATKIQLFGFVSISGWVSFPISKQCAADKTFYWLQDISDPEFSIPDLSTSCINPGLLNHRLYNNNMGLKSSQLKNLGVRSPELKCPDSNSLQDISTVDFSIQVFSTSNFLPLRGRSGVEEFMVDNSGVEV